ncbi:MAG: dTDP-4-dehydrorhamnose 3,5-epimerase family protein [Actinomycetota bacterium]
MPRGARLVDLSTTDDERGAFTEVFRQEWFSGLPAMVQSNLSVSRAGVLRGLHFHRRQADYWCVLEGSAFVALVDVRAGSPTQGRSWWDTFDAGTGLRGLYVPPGVAHGFFALTDMRLQYLVDRAFTGDDEFGFAWNDPSTGIPWPASDPIVSERDASNPSLAEALVDPPAYSA